MSRAVLTFLVTSALLSAPALTVLPAGATAAASPSPTPTHSLTVTGQGVRSYPAFDPSVERYAATTTPATGGRLTITASTTDPTGTIWIDGAPDADGTATVSGLEDGDEVAVFIDDSTGRAVHSVVYLPHGFPELTTPVNDPAATPGHVLITPNRFSAGTDTYEAAVDNHGVPAFVHANRDAASQDLKPTGFGGYTVFRDDDRGDLAGSRLVQLDDAFEPVRELRNQGLVHTDAHDVILREDGSRIMAAYESDHEHHGRQDAVIQEVDPAGVVVRTWNSADHLNPVDPTLTGSERAAAVAETDTMNPFVTDPDGGETLRQDYAHVNSWQLVDDDENLLVSFRHTSSVMKIAWSDAADRTDGLDFGDVVWRLGGKFSDFTFVDDPFAGPCTQHTATQLENGHVLVFDNGSPDPDNAYFNDASMCPDPANPAGEPVGREFTRVTEYALDTRNGTATLVWEHRHPVGAGPDWFALFAGGVNRLPNGNTLISWASARTAVVTEVEAGTNRVVWQLEDARRHGQSPYFSYRAVKHAVTDVVDPAVELTGPPDGTTLSQGSTHPVVGRCRDRGGSSLRACATTGTSAGAVDTSRVGEVVVTLTGRDGAGNAASASRTYQVAAAPAERPDASIRVPGSKWVGNDRYAGPQRVSTGIRRGARTIRVRLENDGGTTARMGVKGVRGTKAFKVRYRFEGRDVTRRVVRGRFTVRLAPGDRSVLRAKVARKTRARVGARLRLRVTVRSRAHPRLADTVRAVVRARKPRGPQRTSGR